MGSSLGPMRGRDGNVHRGKPQEGYLPMISHLSAMISVVNGMLFARKLQKKLELSVLRASAMARLPPARFTKPSIKPPSKTSARSCHRGQSIRLLDADVASIRLRKSCRQSRRLRRGSPNR